MVCIINRKNHCTQGFQSEYYVVADKINLKFINKTPSPYLNP